MAGAPIANFGDSLFGDFIRDAIRDNIKQAQQEKLAEQLRVMQARAKEAQERASKNAYSRQDSEAKPGKNPDGGGNEHNDNEPSKKVKPDKKFWQQANYPSKFLPDTGRGCVF